MCENKFERKPKVIRSDRGGEYTGRSIIEFFKSNGIQIQLTAANCPQQNGTAERKNRTLMEMARCMLIDAALPDTFWGEAVATANFIQNRVVTRSTDTTPFERWNNAKPGMNHFQIFGSKCFVHIHSDKRGKLDDVAVEMIFLGHDQNSKAYRCYNPATKRVEISRDVRFCSSAGDIGGISIDLESGSGTGRANKKENESLVVQEEENEIRGDDTIDESTNNVEEEINGNDAVDNSQIGGKRISQRSTKGIPPQRFVDEIFVAREIGEPKNYEEAIRSEEKEQWLAAMQAEMESHERNGTWELVDLPAGKNAIGGKWVFKIKTGTDGELQQRYKARYVAQGFSQKYGEDYDEVFAPVVFHATFRALLSVAAGRKMMVNHLDAKTAFLNGRLDETIYMKQPRGFDNDDSKVCRLMKSIYGLKQAARSWNEALHTVLVGANFGQSYNDSCMYTRKIDGSFCYIIVYVDDLIVACSTADQMSQVEGILKSHFEMQNLGPIAHYLGMEITKDIHGNFELNQSTYIMKIASDFGLKEAKPAKTPMDVNYGKSRFHWKTIQNTDN